MYWDILILGHLAHGPAHGYEIRKRVEQALGGVVVMHNPVLYSSLKRFEQAGAVTGQLVAQDTGPAKKVYSLTSKGRDALRNLIADFSDDDAGSEAEFNTRLAYFSLVRPAVRVAILGKRVAAVHKVLAHLERVVPELERNRKTQAYSLELVNFLISRHRGEVAWLESLLKAEGAESVA